FLAARLKTPPSVRIAATGDVVVAADRADGAVRDSPVRVASHGAASAVRAGHAAVAGSGRYAHKREGRSVVRRQLRVPRGLEGVLVEIISGALKRHFIRP